MTTRMSIPAPAPELPSAKSVSFKVFPLRLGVTDATLLVGVTVHVGVIALLLLNFTDQTTAGRVTLSGRLRVADLVAEGWPCSMKKMPVAVSRTPDAGVTVAIEVADERLILASTCISAVRQRGPGPFALTRRSDWSARDKVGRTLQPGSVRGIKGNGAD